jgi:hypothetical protein
VHSLAQLWAKRYVENLQDDEQKAASTDSVDLSALTSDEGRSQTVETLKQALRFTSAQAWSKTESLLAKEVQRHRINPELIDPWQIAEDTRYLFERTLEVYANQVPSQQLLSALERSNQPRTVVSEGLTHLTTLPPPGRLSVVISPEVGRIRQKYTAQDPRVLGFVSMQFHYSGQMLLELLSPVERNLLSAYFKVIDDHLYMPLHRAYEAAAMYDYSAPPLYAVRQLLPVSSEIARNICQRVLQLYPSYQSYSGLLGAPAVRVSSLRDVEMFQVYLCLCVLEGKITALQDELFPLCVMLYPPLSVRWELVRTMLRLLGQELTIHLDANAVTLFKPYSRALWEMFAPEVLPDE